MSDMIEAIKSFFLDTVGRELCVFFCSMLPIIELRGAIPLGAGLGLPMWQSYLLSVVGNLLPVPFLLLLWRWVLRRMHRIHWTKGIAEWLEERAERSRGKIERYEFWGLLIFVAIPLPGTGAWTGSLAAAVMGMKFPRALLSVVGGVLLAGAVMLLLSYGTVAVFDLWF